MGAVPPPLPHLKYPPIVPLCMAMRAWSDPTTWALFSSRSSLGELERTGSTKECRTQCHSREIRYTSPDGRRGGRVGGRRDKRDDATVLLLLHEAIPARCAAFHYLNDALTSPNSIIFPFTVHDTSTHVLCCYQLVSTSLLGLTGATFVVGTPSPTFGYKVGSVNSWHMPAAARRSAVV